MPGVKRVKLEDHDLATFFVVYEHCDIKQLVEKESLLKYTEITCKKCDQPIMFRASNGNWYKSAEMII